MHRVIMVGAVVVLLVAIVQISRGCNEAICASVVSKCMLTQSCKCDLKDCSCCKECFRCLDYLYTECCSCVDMCPKPNETNNELSKKSYVEQFGDSVPGLFAALTSEPDQLQRWLSITFPVDFDVTHYSAKESLYLQSVDHESVDHETGVTNPNVITMNCTVAYMSQCLSCDKCRASCQSMGSSSIRWFHDGCCECIGDKCINYGINESRCLACPDGKDSGARPEDDDDLLNYDEDSLDYGEDGDPQTV